MGVSAYCSACWSQKRLKSGIDPFQGALLQFFEGTESSYTLAKTREQDPPKLLWEQDPPLVKFPKTRLWPHFSKCNLCKTFTNQHGIISALKKRSCSEFFKIGLGFENWPILRGLMDRFRPDNFDRTPCISYTATIIDSGTVRLPCFAFWSVQPKPLKLASMLIHHFKALIWGY